MHSRQIISHLCDSLKFVDFFQLYDYFTTCGLNELPSRQMVIELRKYKPFSQRTPCNSNASEPDVSWMLSLSLLRRSCVDTYTGLRSKQITHFLRFIAIQNKK